MYEYGDHGQPAIQEGRPLSFLPAARDEILMGRPEADNRTFAQRAPLTRTQSDRIHGAPQHPPIHQHFADGRSNSAQQVGNHGPSSTSPRSPAETAASSFPLNDIDYESSPAAVAQELSNLQAIRRMSMDVNPVADPDLPSFGMTPMAPVDSDDEDDASRLFWVPARLHPELAPKEFKTFIDTRVESIRRRSGDFSLSPDSPMRSSSEGGLMRKKSMLSRQIDTNAKNADQYQDGAERLDRKRSLGEAGKRTSSGIQNLQELEQLMQDPSKMIQRLSMESHLLAEQIDSEDMPILSVAPGGNSLRRSTRTTYRRGSLRKGERIPPSRRAQRSNLESESGDISPKTRQGPFSNDLAPSMGLNRVQTDPVRSEPAQVPESPAPIRPAGNFSRPGRRGIPLTTPVPSMQPDQVQTLQSQRSDDQLAQSRKSPPPPRDQEQDMLQRQASVPPQVNTIPPSREPKHFVSQFSSNGRTTARLDMPSSTEVQVEEKKATPNSYYSDRDSSHNQQQPRSTSVQQPSHTVNRTKQRTGMGPQPVIEQQTLQHMAAHPSPLPGNSTRTDSLSFIPTLTEDKRAEPKKDAKKSGWSWGSLLGNEEKEKERRKEEELREANNKKLRQKLDKPVRLDLLQQTVDNGVRGRESLVLDRGDTKLEEERKKESNRKANEAKKEKDPGLFSSLFGGKKKHDRDPAGQKSLHPPSPNLPAPVLIPDEDYKWTRFSILEERAIYRMAHIKLANPRRALYSQVLLSNFMYSYLAKVQQMHPQIQIPQSAAQKAAQRAAQQQQQAQQAQQQQAQQQQEQQEQLLLQQAQQQQQQELQVQQHQAQPIKSRRKDQPEEYYQYQRYQEVK